MIILNPHKSKWVYYTNFIIDLYALARHPYLSTSPAKRDMFSIINHAYYAYCSQLQPNTATVFESLQKVWLSPNVRHFLEHKFLLNLRMSCHFNIVTLKIRQRLISMIWPRKMASHKQWQPQFFVVGHGVKKHLL